MSKVPNGPPLEERNQLDSVANLIRIPLSVSPTLLFPGTGTKLTNFWVLKVLTGTLLHSLNCSRTHMIVTRHEF